MTRQIRADVPAAIKKLNIRTIVVPTDFSAASNRALDTATVLARQFGASLHVIHVLGTPAPAGAIGTAATPLPTVPQLVPTLDDERRAMKLNLQAVTQRCQSLGIRSSGELLTHAGNPQYAILQAVTEAGADMIVMGTHGRSGLTRLVAGSVTEAVLRHSRIPVLAVPPPDKQAAS